MLHINSISHYSCMVYWLWIRPQ